MLIEYYGHSCFAITGKDHKIVIDPYGPEVGYKLPQRGATHTLVSHDHFDHNNVAAVTGRTNVVRGLAGRRDEGLKIHGVMADHDAEGGSRLGKVTIFVVELEGLRLVHLSDLGALLNKEQIDEIGRVDVLFVPTGGGQYTLGPKEAHHTVQQLKPAVAVPMHYRTPFLNRELFPQLQPLEDYQKLSGAERGSHELVWTTPSAGTTRVIAMAHRF